MSGPVKSITKPITRATRPALGAFRSFGGKLTSLLGLGGLFSNPDAPAFPGQPGIESPPDLTDAEAREAAARRRRELAGRQGFRGTFITGPGGVSENVGVQSILSGG